MSQNSRKFNHPKLGFLLGLAIALVVPTLASSSPAAPPKPTTRTTEQFRCQLMYGNQAEKFDNLAISESIDITGASGYTIDYKVILEKSDRNGDYIYNLLPKS